MKTLLSGIAAFIFTTSVSMAAMTSEVLEVRSEWVRIKYQMPKEERVDALEALAVRAHQISSTSTNSAESLIWEAIVLASLAGEDGGLGALSKVKQARKLLEQAESIDADSLDGSVYTSLGSLYYQVPGWPIGFGNDEKAEQYLKKALALNPEGIDPNYFYGDYLISQGKYQQAITVLEKALQAPARPDRPLADEGRRSEVMAAIDKARSKL